MKTKVFISFDYDHDSDLKVLLVKQYKPPSGAWET